MVHGANAIFSIAVHKCATVIICDPQTVGGTLSEPEDGLVCWSDEQVDDSVPSVRNANTMKTRRKLLRCAIISQGTQKMAVSILACARNASRVHERMP